jgi:serine/threonine-protein kinase
MGEVYRARDTRLKRDIALKILPEAVAGDPDRLARFQREAEVLASLNHPHIAGIYGLEVDGEVRALVMELVEGEDLSERIARGPIPLNEALPIAKQIAEALEAAHEQGIIHRDLKPANIKVTPDGVVKVLDFGLAKLNALNAPNAPNASNDPNALSLSPTITSPAMMTGVGVILGTAAYMAPEQAKGREADKRSDIWAFGCVLFEMLTGKRPFDGEDMVDVLSRVLQREPEWAALPAGVSQPLRTLLQSCLVKDRRNRIADIAAALFVLDHQTDLTTTDTVAAGPLPRRPLWRSVVTSVAVILATSTVVGVVVWFATRPSAPRVTRTAIGNTGTAALMITGVDRDLAITPDGIHVVYIGNSGTQLFVRALDALEPVAIASGQSQLRGPFVSPDGQWVGFVDNGILRKVAITGGPAITLDADLDGPSRGATWTPDGTMIFATGNQATGLQSLSVNGGTPEVLTRPDHAQGEADHLWPEILPGGNAVLFTITSVTGGLDASEVAVRDLRTGTQKVLLRGGSHPHYMASGHLVYVAAGTLRAIVLDPNLLETHGTAVPVLPRLATTGSGAGDFAVAADGTLIYVDAPGSLGATARTLVWVDRLGKEAPVAAPPRAYEQPRLSPDGTRIALFSTDQEKDLWIWDVGRATLTRLTLDPGQDSLPCGRRRSSDYLQLELPAARICFRAAAAPASRRLTTASAACFSTRSHRTGTVAVFNNNGDDGRDLMQLARRDRPRDAALQTSSTAQREFSYGRWLAYESNSSGLLNLRPAISKRRRRRWQVSTAGEQRLGAERAVLHGSDNALQRVPVEARAQRGPARQ